MSIKKVHIVNAHQKWNGIAEGNLTRHYIEIMSKVLDNNQMALLKFKWVSMLYSLWRNPTYPLLSTQ